MDGCVLDLPAPVQLDLDTPLRLGRGTAHLRRDYQRAHRVANLPGHRSHQSRIHRLNRYRGAPWTAHGADQPDVPRHDLGAFPRPGPQPVIDCIPGRAVPGRRPCIFTADAGRHAELLEHLRGEIAVEEQQLLDKDPDYEPGRIGDLVSMEKRLTEYKVTVFRFSTVTRLALYAIIGFLSWLGAAAVSVFVESLFEI